MTKFEYCWEPVLCWPKRCYRIVLADSFVILFNTCQMRLKDGKQWLKYFFPCHWECVSGYGICITFPRDIFVELFICSGSKKVNICLPKLFLTKEVSAIGNSIIDLELSNMFYSHQARSRFAASERVIWQSKFPLDFSELQSFLFLSWY